MKNLLNLVCLVILTSTFSYSQSTSPFYDMRLEQVSNSPESSCYEVQIRSSNDRSFNLAGQNYRLFYDASDVSFNASQSYSLLPTNDYTDMVVVQNIQNVNASSFSSLGFSSNLSFLNYFMDLNDVLNGGIDVASYDEGWTPTSHICFDHNSASVENEGFDAVWGRPGKTETLATAFVEVSEWKARNYTGPAKRYLMFDEIADGAESSYDIRLHMTSTSTSQSCYQIQLKSNNYESWKLSGQNYRLYFDADQVQYLPSNSTSLLPSQYTEYTDVSYFNGVNATGYGLLPYESNLGFINSYIDLDNLLIGGVDVPNDQSWLPTVELCFEHIAQGLIDEDVVGFDTSWGRDGLTNGYARAYVEIAEWVSPTMGDMATAYEYFDLNQTPAEVILPRNSGDSEVITDVDIYPNPATEYINLEYNLTEDDSDLDITIVNATGQNIYSNMLSNHNAEKGENSLNIPISNLNDGHYYIQLSNNGKSITKSFQKQQ